MARNNRPERQDSHRINEQIRARRVLVIDDEGNRLGEFLPQDAMILAQERGLDLVEVSPNEDTPVCKILDYGRYRYEKSKRDKEQRKGQSIITTKEVRLRPKTDEHDIQVRVKQVRKFLSKGNKVKVVIRFRGREHAHREIGAQQCQKILQEVEDIGKVESPPHMEGRIMQMLLSPL